MNKKTDDDIVCEQRARDLLEACGVEKAQSFSSGDVLVLANYVHAARLSKKVADKFVDLVDDLYDSKYYDVVALGHYDLKRVNELTGGVL